MGRSPALICLSVLTLALGVASTAQGAVPRGGRADPSDALSSPFLLPIFTWAIPPKAPCLSAANTTAGASFGFDGAPGPAENGRAVPAAGFSLHGNQCEGAKADVWALPTDLRQKGVMGDAGRAMLYLKRGLVGGDNSTLKTAKFLLAEAKDGSDGILCGRGLRVKRWLLVFPTERLDPAVNSPEGASGLDPGGRYVAMEIMGKDGEVVSCAYGEGREAVEARDAKDASRKKKASEGESGGGGGSSDLGGKEVAGIAAGITGAVLAVIVVIVAAVLWRRQKLRHPSIEAESMDEYDDGGFQGEEFETEHLEHEMRT